MTRVFGPARIRAKVGQAEPGQGHDGKWFFELSIWNIEGTEMAGEPFVIGPWDSEKIARVEMKRAVELVSQAMSDGKSDGYMDLKNGGTFRKWQEN